MKTALKMSVIAACSLLLVNSCGNKEKAGAKAIATFKTEMVAIAVVIKQVGNADEAEAPAAIVRLHSKLQPVSTTGLPADLKTTFENYRAVTEKMSTAIRKLPFDYNLLGQDEKLAKFGEEQTAKDPKFPAKVEKAMEIFNKEWEVLIKDLGTTGQELEVALKKHQVEGDWSGLSL